MRNGLYLLQLAIVLLLGVSFAWRAGYKVGQRDALQGIYVIDQDERDALDPSGHHHFIPAVVKD